MATVQEIWAAVYPYLSLATLACMYLLFRYYAPEKIKGRIQHEYAERLETLKAELKAGADVEIEKFKSQASVETEKLRSQLSIAAAERHVRFSKLHERRAEVIAELYKRLFETLVAIDHYVREDIPVGAVQEAPPADTALDALSDYFGQNRIFVPKHVADLTEKILRKYNLGFTFGLAGHRAPNQAEKSEFFKTAEETLVQLGEALVDLEREFRTLLGDEAGKGG